MCSGYINNQKIILFDWDTYYKLQSSIFSKNFCRKISSVYNLSTTLCLSSVVVNEVAKLQLIFKTTNFIFKTFKNLLPVVCALCALEKRGAKVLNFLLLSSFI